MIAWFLYVLWATAIIAVLVTTFTGFQYEDLNFIAVGLLLFALVNAYFASHRRK